MPRHIEQPAPRHSAPASLEDDVEALGLGLQPHPRRAGHDEHPDVVGDLATVDDAGGGAQVLDPPVGARADEHGVHGDVAHRVPALEAHVRPARARPRRARPRRRTSSGSGTRPDSGTPCAGLVPQVTNGVSAARVEVRPRVSKVASSSVAQRPPVLDRGVPVAPRGACGRPCR
ncbi:MAG: hypothetical protein WKF83_11730 [Nocardioidaceae bacterium]